MLAFHRKNPNTTEKAGIHKNEQVFSGFYALQSLSFRLIWIILEAGNQQAKGLIF